MGPGHNLWGHLFGMYRAKIFKNLLLLIQFVRITATCLEASSGRVIKDCSNYDHNSYGGSQLWGKVKFLH